MAALCSVVVLLSLFCGAFCQSDIETDIANALSSWTADQQGELLSDAVSKFLQQQLKETPVDWSNTEIVFGDVDEYDDDVINLDLADSELVGGCSHGDCEFCKGFKKWKFCFEAKLLKLGFDIKLTINNHVIYDKEISVKNPPPVCVKAPFVGQTCIEIYNVDLKNKSGCVRVIFKVKIGPFKKSIKLKIKCFRFKGEEDTRLNFIKLVQKLANKQTNNLL